MPFGVSSGCIIAPAKAAGPPASAMIGCDVRCRIASSPPGRMCSRNAISLHIVPDGRKTAASMPEQRGDPLAQLGDLRVLEALLVAHLGLRHGVAHGGGRAGLRV